MALEILNDIGFRNLVTLIIILIVGGILVVKAISKQIEIEDS